MHMQGNDPVLDPCVCITGSPAVRCLADSGVALFNLLRWGPIAVETDASVILCLTCLFFH